MKLSEVGGSAAPMKLSQVSSATQAAPDPWSMGGAYGGADPSLSGADVKEAGKGFVEGAIGLPVQVAKSLFRFGKQTPDQYDTGIFAKPKDERAQGYRDIGGVVGAIATPVPGIKAAKAVGETAIEAVPRLLPGATKRAAALVDRIGTPQGADEIGTIIQKQVVGRLNAAKQARQAEFQKWMASRPGGTEAEFDRTAGKKYAELSKDVNQFADALGKKISRTGGYGEVLMTDPTAIAQSAFKTPASVRSLKALMDDDAAVSELARNWTARQLHDVTRPAIMEQKEAIALRSVKAANAARQWLDKAEWLNELPEVKAEAEKFVTNFEKVAKTQTRARWAATGGLLAGASEAFGYHPISRVLRLGGM